MNNLRAIIQDELKQALAGLIPLPAVEMTPVAPTISPAIFSPIAAHVPTVVPPAVVPPAVVNPPIVNAPPASNNNAGG